LVSAHGLVEWEFGRNQGAAFLGDFNMRHRSVNFFRGRWPLAAIA